jgi:hypothetical protein
MFDPRDAPDFMLDDEMEDRLSGGPDFPYDEHDFDGFNDWENGEDEEW